MVSTSWKNNISSTQFGTWTFDDGSTLRPILAIYSYRQPNYTFGFLKNAASSSNNSFYLSILKHPISTNLPFHFLQYSPVVLWCANREHPVGENSSLEFAADGNLVLTDTDGTLVWSTNTSGSSATRMRLDFGGNLRLVSSSNDVKWESFDYPTDTWAPNQLLRYGQRLTSSVSKLNFSSGFFYLSVTDNGIYAFNESYPQESFHTLFPYDRDYATFNFGIGSLNQLKNYVKYEPYGRDFQYIRLEPDGRLCVYQLIGGYNNTFVSNLFSEDGITGQESVKKTGSSSSLLERLEIPFLVSASIVFLIFIFGFLVWRKRKLVNVERRRESIGEEVTSQVQDGLIKFSYEDLQSATNKFDLRSKLGQGGYGEVFEGVLQGNRVAVKCLRTGVGEGRRDFKTEVHTLGRIHHVNLVKLIGYCIRRLKRLLVYEYMSNGSLDKWIFEGQGQALSWEIKKNIIAGIAKGLLYLHESCNPNIIHFDIKPQNILLDQNFKAKIADFGLAKILERDESQVQTRRKGTGGYMAPELWTDNNVSAKVDVFSFGIVILEIVSGRKNSWGRLDQEELLINVVKTKVEEGQLYDLVDHELVDKDEPVRMFEIAMRCLQPYNTRPSISTVLKLIEGLLPMEPIIDYSFLAYNYKQREVNPPGPTTATPLLADILSAPR